MDQPTNATLPVPFPVPIVQCLLWDPTKSKLDPDQQVSAAKRADDASLFASNVEIFAKYVRMFGYLGLSVLIWVYFTPSLEEARSLEADWIVYILLRNLVTMVIFYGGWHVFLYGPSNKGPLLSKLKLRKFNQKAISYDVGHDAFFTLLGWLMSTACEVGMMHLMANGTIPSYTDFWSHPAYSILHLIYVPNWHEIHFYLGHRLLHIPFLYKYVHSLHHKARNPGPFSGLSMHPVEHFIYFSSFVTAFVYTLHPLHLLFQQTYSRISPLAGHDGFACPAGDSLFHYMHHVKTDVNFGSNSLPMDKLFGTYDNGASYKHDAKFE